MANETTVISVAIYGVNINTCFLNRLKLRPMLIKSGCIYDGQQIDIMKLLLLGLTPQYILSNGYGQFHEGEWTPGILRDVANGHADMTSAVLFPQTARIGQLDILVPFPLHEKKYFIINPAPNIPFISIFNAVDAPSASLLIVGLCLTAIVLLLGRMNELGPRTMKIIDFFTMLFNIWLQQRNRKLWRSRSDKIIITIWSMLIARVLYGCMKSNFYRQFKASIPIPQTFRSLAQFSDQYDLIFGRTTNTFDMIFNAGGMEMEQIRKAYGTRIKFVTDHEVGKIIIENAGSMSFVTRSSGLRYRYANKRLILNLIKPVESVIKTSFFGPNLTTSIRTKIRRNAHSMVEFGLDVKVQHAYSHDIVEDHPTDYHKVSIEAWYYSFRHLGMSYLICLFGFILEHKQVITI